VQSSADSGFSASHALHCQPPPADDGPTPDTVVPPKVNPFATAGDPNEGGAAFAAAGAPNEGGAANPAENESTPPCEKPPVEPKDEKSLSLLTTVSGLKVTMACALFPS
jgi:hypothetical protein